MLAYCILNPILAYFLTFHFKSKLKYINICLHKGCLRMFLKIRLQQQSLMNSQKDLQKIKDSDKQAYQGARIFYYSFNLLSLSLFLYYNFLTPNINTLLSSLVIIGIFILNILYYRRCHTTVTFIQHQDFQKIESQHQIQTSNTYPAFHYCKYCNSQRGYRVKHCHKCGHCIYKFDHHCFWIGNCVGQLNHHYFYYFLFTQTLLNCIFTITYFGVMGLSGFGVIMTLMFIIGVSFITFTGYLLLYHSLLLVTAQTTWEHMRRPYISYLKYLPIGYNPFSQGLINNIVEFFCRSDQTPKQYKVPSYEQAKNIIVPFNICENKYYSCC